MFTKQRKSNILYAIFALLFSLVLFFNANRTTVTTHFSSANEHKQVIENVPIDIKYDEDKYFIQGYQPTVSVELSSVNRVQLNVEANQDTRRFRVVADLSDLPVGTHDVPLTVKGLSNSVTAKLKTKIFTVTIEKKTTKELPVEVHFSQENLQDGFQLDKIVAEPKKVKVTTGEETLKEIDKVVADLSSLKDVVKDLDEEVPLVAVNKQGESLPATIEPESIRVQATVYAPEKQIGLYVEPIGEVPKNVLDYTITMSQTYATISGAQHLLDNIIDIPLSIDISKIKKETTRVVDIPVQDGISVDPHQITVKITPVLKEQQGSNVEETVDSEVDTVNETSTTEDSAESTDSQETTSSTEASTTDSSEGSTEGSTEESSTETEDSSENQENNESD